MQGVKHDSPGSTACNWTAPFTTGHDALNMTVLMIDFTDLPRLAGLDFLGYTISQRPGYSALLVLFMIFQAIILLNGLIGVFGNAFVAAATGTQAAPEVKKSAEDALESGRARGTDPAEAKPPAGRSKGNNGKVGTDGEGDDEEPELIDLARTEMKESHNAAFWAFVLVGTLFALAEPVLICLRDRLPHDQWIGLQYAVLAASTVLYVAFLVATFRFVDREKAPRVLHRIYILYDGEVKFETACLAIGWVCLITNPGIAALRCMRVFRMLWFFELVEHKKLDDPGAYPLDISKCFHLCVQVCGLHVRLCRWGSDLRHHLSYRPPNLNSILKQHKSAPSRPSHGHHSNVSRPEPVPDFRADFGSNYGVRHLRAALIYAVHGGHLKRALHCQVARCRGSPRHLFLRHLYLRSRLLHRGAGPGHSQRHQPGDRQHDSLRHRPRLRHHTDAADPLRRDRRVAL